MILIFALKDVLLLAIFFVVISLPLLEIFVLPVIKLGGILVCLRVSYVYAVNNMSNVIVIYGSNNRARVTQVFAIIGLLIILAFAFSEHKNYQERLVIRDICIQFGQALAQGEHKTAYNLMSPDYQQTYSFAQFIAREGREVWSCGPAGKYLVVAVQKGGTEASITHYPPGGLNVEIFFEKVNHQWYLTGKVRLFEL